MKEVGSKIKEIRKRKGLSQEELAEESKVNLRTIQRIEKGDSEPRGKTLSLICDVLGVDIESLLDYGKKENKSLLVILHLSAMSFLILPLGNIIIPLVLWVTNKNKVAGVKEAGANLINFQICWTIITFLSTILWALGKILRFSFSEYLNFANFLYLLVILYLINIILPIVFAIRVNKGKINSRYPRLLTIIK